MSTFIRNEAIIKRQMKKIKKDAHWLEESLPKISNIYLA